MDGCDNYVKGKMEIKKSPGEDPPRGFGELRELRQLPF
jgi:hypothetical protein